MGQLSQGSGLSGNVVHATAALFKTLMSESEMSTVTSDAILVTTDGFGFGTLTGESCLKNVHCHTDRASWDAILVTPSCGKSVHSHTDSAWGGWGGDATGGGGGRRTENRDHLFAAPSSRKAALSQSLQSFSISRTGSTFSLSLLKCFFWAFPNFLVSMT